MEKNAKTAKTVQKKAKTTKKPTKVPQTVKKPRAIKQKVAADSLEAKVERLKEEAKRKGLLDNLLFEELLDEFTYQTNLLKRLRAEIDNGELLTPKTYVKSAPNMSPNKLIATYNATSNARVNTVSAIAKIVKTLGDDGESSRDPLLEIINGG